MDPACEHGGEHGGHVVARGVGAVEDTVEPAGGEGSHGGALSCGRLGATGIGGLGGVKGKLAEGRGSRAYGGVMEAVPREARTGVAFPATPWTMLELSGGDGTVARRALDRVCCLYWVPLYAYLRGSGHGPAESEDLTQGYFGHLLEKGVLRRADAEKGRLRSYLIGGLKLYLRDEQRRGATQKRGGGMVVAGMDPARLEAELVQTGLAGETPDEVYERRWAVSLLGNALAALREEEERAGRGSAFGVLSEYLVRGGASVPQVEAAAGLGMSENALSVAVHRLRRRLQAVFRAQVAATVGSEEEVEEEIRHLRALFLKG